VIGVPTLRCPVCPLCGEPPTIILAGAVQAFCGNDSCRAMCWNPSDTAAGNLRVNPVAEVVAVARRMRDLIAGDHPLDDADCAAAVDDLVDAVNRLDTDQEPVS